MPCNPKVLKILCVLLTTKVINISGSEVTLNLKYIYLLIYTSIMSPDLGILRVLSFLIYPTTKIRDFNFKIHIELSFTVLPTTYAQAQPSLNCPLTIVSPKRFGFCSLTVYSPNSSRRAPEV